MSSLVVKVKYSFPVSHTFVCFDEWGIKINRRFARNVPCLLGRWGFYHLSRIIQKKADPQQEFNTWCLNRIYVAPAGNKRDTIPRRLQIILYLLERKKSNNTRFHRTAYLHAGCTGGT